MKFIVKISILFILLKNYVEGQYESHLPKKRSAIDISQPESELWINWCIENGNVSKINEKNIKQAFDMVEYMSCLVFIQFTACPENSKEQLIIFEDDTNNEITSFEFDSNETPISAPYRLKIDHDCNTKPGCILRKVLLYLGLILTHRRSDRDNFIYLNTSYADPNHLREFDIIEHADFANTNYDYGSIMHISTNYMSSGSNKIFTTIPNKYESMVGQENWLSFTDIKILNSRYCEDQCNLIKESRNFLCKNGGIISPFTCKSCICPNMFAGDESCSKLEYSDPSCPESKLVATNNENILVFKSEQTCNVVIKAEKDRKIKVTVNKARLPTKNPCFERLGLEIKYRKDKTVTGLCLCIVALNVEVISEDNLVYIQYNGNLNGHMAHITYQQI